MPKRQQQDVVYDLDVAAARGIHDEGCPGEACWCSGMTEMSQFRKGLLSNVLLRTGFQTSSFVRSAPGRLVIVRGPGIKDQDDEPIHDAIRGIPKDRVGD